MTCSSVPDLCGNGGTCIDDPAKGFTCQCPGTHSGARCNLYQRCYPDVRACFQTDYVKLGYDAATHHCLRQGNATKPIILSDAHSAALESFVRDDPDGQLATDSVWLAAEARRISDNSMAAAYWRWLDGLLTSKRCFCNCNCNFIFIVTIVIFKRANRRGFTVREYDLEALAENAQYDLFHNSSCSTEHGKSKTSRFHAA